MANACFYIIQEDGTGHCKVGVTSNIVSRLSSLQTGNPRKLTVYFSTAEDDRETMEQIEYRMLMVNRDRGKMGEWLNIPAEEIKTQLEEVLMFVFIRQAKLGANARRAGRSMGVAYGTQA